MRTQYFTLLFIAIGFLLLNADNYKVYSSIDDLCISFEEDKNKYNLYFESGGYLNDSIRHFSPVTFELYSQGNYCINNNQIVCTDSISKHRLIFEKIDNYSIKVVDADDYLRKSELLWLTLNRSDTTEVFMKWKNGKKTGYWLYFQKDGVCSLIQYKDNTPIDSIRFESTEKMKLFLLDNRH